MLGRGFPSNPSAEQGSALQVKRLPGFAPSLCRRQGEGWGGVLFEQSQNPKKNKKRAEARFLLYPQLPVDYLLRPSTALRRLYRA